jgi:hypothetical protein
MLLQKAGLSVDESKFVRFENMAQIRNLKQPHLSHSRSWKPRHFSKYTFKILLLQSALQPLVGCRPAQLSLSILNRKVLESAVASGTSNPSTWRRTRDLERSKFLHKRPPASEATLANPAAERGTMGEKWSREFCRKWWLPRHFWVLLHAVKHDMGQTALLPLRRKACSGFFTPKNPTASARFEPANLGTKGQHATSRPPKPLLLRL